MARTPPDESEDEAAQKKKGRAEKIMDCRGLEIRITEVFRLVKYRHFLWLC
jgi:hypothetical protein